VKKTVLMMLLLASTPAWATDIYLEGVSILGKNKTAHLTVNGSKLSVSEGGTVEQWTVMEIAPRMISLRDAEGRIQELELHSQLTDAPPEVEPQVVVPAVTTALGAPPAMNPDDNPFLQAIKARAEQQAKENPTPPSDVTPPQPVYEPKRIADEEVPPGHRRVRTPFGDVLVKE
jgi:hypothetical protein